MAITSTLPAAPFIPLNVPAEPSRLRRPRGLALGGVPVEPRRFATANPRADGDSELAGQVGKALLQVRGEYAYDDAIMIEHIPPNSTFGQWWSQLGRAMESPQVRWSKPPEP
ncbi:hypothetical protein RGV33_15890 [Pseudomonas sp. Bout1]|uniref:hypothetical protein n=1 Tax=Pseudomonas sp. Bout1 TaxID=3048600 RepID=UPI002AB40F1C|nr:hypothetical protein [Pseudomonas sp. Bout1]MDY7533147.1 hypothetical protein [Pseudomonas sp. Bout1]MEB0186995.1 hypothetical protein [Pseudomonas sp. Bout1]